MCAHLKIEFHPQLLLPYQQLENKMTDGLYADSKPMGDVRLLQHGKIKASLAHKWKGVEKDNFLHDTSWQIAKVLAYPLLEETTKAINPKPTTVGKYLLRYCHHWNERTLSRR